MKVSGINNVYFKGGTNSPQNKPMQDTKVQTDSLASVTPDFGVKVPQKITKLGISKLDNGLDLHSYKLGNGYRVSIVPMEGSPSVVKTYVNVGSMNETPDIKGISHFLEHMAFNGTNGENGHIKLETGDSFKKIDEIGGWANASTNYAVTDYVNSAPLLDDKDLETQIKVLAAMTEDLKLSDKMIEKEKGPVCSEINMIMDDPNTVALDQTVRTLFNIKNPADELVGGSVAHIKNLTRKDVLDYYNKYYTPDNINIVITGDVNPDEIINTVAKNFTSKKSTQGKKFEEKLSPIQSTKRKDFISDKAKSAQIVLGFTGPKNNSVRDKVIFDLALEYIDSYDSGLRKNIQKYHSEPFVDFEKISNNPNANRFLYIAMTTAEKNCENLLQTVFDTISTRKPITDETLKLLKERIKTNRELSMEYSTNVNGMIGNAVLNNNLELAVDYNKILDDITADELNNAINEYFNLNKTAITVIHPKDNNVSFKGKARKPVNENLVTETTLNNNYNVGFYKSKSENINYVSDYVSHVPFNKKAAIGGILNEIYSMGTNDMSEDEFNKFKDRNNIKIQVNASNSGIFANFSGNPNNYKLGIDTIQNLIHNPGITEENLKKAKEKIKDRIERSEDNSRLLYYNEYDAVNCPYSFTDKEILDSLDGITVDDIKELHNYLIRNSQASVRANIPESMENVKDFIINSVEKQSKAMPKNYDLLSIHKKEDKPIVLTKANNNSQADILQIYNYKTDDSVKSEVVSELMTSILSGSSIGLFDILREKEHLAYSVHAFSSRYDDKGEIALSILTTTDNKDIGEKSYDNVQKSVDGFRRQINELIAGKFTDEDLASAKKIMKAKLLDNEGVYSKLMSLDMTSKDGIYRQNLLFNMIDSVTKDDITDFAKYVFASKPITSVVATQDTLDANKEYFKTLEEQ